MNLVLSSLSSCQIALAVYWASHVLVILVNLQYGGTDARPLLQGSVIMSTIPEGIKCRPVGFYGLNRTGQPANTSAMARVLFCEYTLVAALQGGVGEECQGQIINTCKLCHGNQVMHAKSRSSVYFKCLEVAFLPFWCGPASVFNEEDDKCHQVQGTLGEIVRPEWSKPNEEQEQNANQLVQSLYRAFKFSGLWDTGNSFGDVFAGPSDKSNASENLNICRARFTRSNAAHRKGGIKMGGEEIKNESLRRDDSTQQQSKLATSSDPTSIYLMDESGNVKDGIVQDEALVVILRDHKINFNLLESSFLNGSGEVQQLSLSNETLNDVDRIINIVFVAYSQMPLDLNGEFTDSKLSNDSDRPRSVRQSVNWTYSDSRDSENRKGSWLQAPNKDGSPLHSLTKVEMSLVHNVNGNLKVLTFSNSTILPSSSNNSEEETDFDNEEFPKSDNSWMHDVLHLDNLLTQLKEFLGNSDILNELPPITPEIPFPKASFLKKTTNTTSAPQTTEIQNPPVSPQSAPPPTVDSAPNSTSKPAPTFVPSRHSPKRESVASYTQFDKSAENPPGGSMSEDKPSLVDDGAEEMVEESSADLQEQLKLAFLPDYLEEDARNSGRHDRIIRVLPTPEPPLNPMSEHRYNHWILKNRDPYVSCKTCVSLPW